MESIEQVRSRFARQIQELGAIRSAGLIEGLASVPRERFVGPGPWKIIGAAQQGLGYVLTPDDDPRHLYQNVVVALDAARYLNNGEPLSVLKFLDSLELAPGERLLHVGCGAGYFTAIAAHAVGVQGWVRGVELDPQLAARARENLEAYPQVEVTVGDGAAGPFGTFDAIFVNAGCTRPQAVWLEQLAPGGRLLLPLTASIPMMPGLGKGVMVLLRREEGGYRARVTSPVAIFHCAGARDPGEEERLGRALRRGGTATVTGLRCDAHEPEESCWFHTESFCVQCDPSRQRKKPAAIEMPIAQLAGYVGRYLMAPEVLLEVILTQEALWAQLPGRPQAMRLYPSAENEVCFEEINAMIRFVRQEGRITGLVLELDGLEMPAARME